MNETSTLPLLAQVTENPAVQKIGGAALEFYSSYLWFFKSLGVLLTAFFLGATVFFMIRTGWLATRVDRVEDVILKSNVPKRRSLKAWKKIEKRFFEGDENSLKLALIEADNILDEALKIAGYRGENLGERLKKITNAQVPTIDQIWEAHKLRNKLVHDMTFKLDRNIAEKALSIYEQALQDLGVLDSK